MLPAGGGGRNKNASGGVFVASTSERDRRPAQSGTLQPDAWSNSAGRGNEPRREGAELWLVSARIAALRPFVSMPC